ncbi:hypothetical protein ANCCAN_27723 [Ancylostoma caninum]|uniref:Uncharacterized protein n=1 Tax=Ancylostoma caninum TaxID=29170 RepID=A0A368F377_ANCCA|nr:hypothetical protein ANCCAN_27723 [Ancylostoma caninum]
MQIYIFFASAALEVGCSQLGTIMRAANPAGNHSKEVALEHKIFSLDPTNQIAALANAMGISPTPFTSMLQNATGITTLNTNSLMADAAGARDQLTTPYSLAPATTYDSLQYQGFTERDISSYLL